MRVHKEYRARRPVEALVPRSRFYLVRNPKWETTGLWYKQAPMGTNRLGLLCRSMCERAGLSARHTNHSVRRTAVWNLLERGIHETKVQQLSGHKNVQSLNTYRTNSFNQQQIMSYTQSKTLTSYKHLDTFPTINHSSYQAITYPPEPTPALAAPTRSLRLLPSTLNRLWLLKLLLPKTSSPLAHRRWIC